MTENYLRAISRNLPINSRGLETVLKSSKKVVIAAECGSGKTIGFCDLASEIYGEKGILYVGETIKQLNSVYNNLIDLGVPKDSIVNFHSAHEDYTLSDDEISSRAIALITHSRLFIEEHHKFLNLNPVHKIGNRKLMVVDEALKPAVIGSISKILASASFKEYLEPKYYNLLPEPIKDKRQMMACLYQLRPLIKQFAELSPSDFLQATSIRINGLDIKGVKSVPEKKREYIIGLLFRELLAGRGVKEDHSLIVSIPIAPQLSWYENFEEILILDATVRYNRCLYQNDEIEFEIFDDDEFARDYSLIAETYIYDSDIDLTRTNIKKKLETFTAVDLDKIAELAKEKGFCSPYVVTFKEFEEEATEKFGKHFEGKAFVSHYGCNRGSNEFRECDSVVLIGAYRLPVKFVTELRQTLYSSIDPSDTPKGHWVQEIYRTSIRDGKPIKMLIAGEGKIIEEFLAELEIVPEKILNELSNRDILEISMQKKTSKIGQTILNGLRKDGCISIREVSRRNKWMNKQQIVTALNRLLASNKKLRGLVGVVNGDVIQLNSSKIISDSLKQDID